MEIGENQQQQPPKTPGAAVGTGPSVIIAKVAKRLQKEQADLSLDPPLLCSAGPKGGNLLQWMATVTGPPDTPYEDGIFFLEFTFPPTYPFHPPKVVFRTRIYHCNVGTDDGELCMSVLKNAWSPSVTIRSLLLSISSLMSQPNPQPILRLVFAILPLRYLSDILRRLISNAYVYTRKQMTGNASAAQTQASLLADAESKAEKLIEGLHNTEDFVRFWGFPFEPHYTATKDGYILALHRIPHSRSEQEILSRNPGGNPTTAEGRRSRPRANSNSSISSISSLLNQVNRPAASSSNQGSNATTPSQKPVVLLWHGFMMCSEVWVCSPSPSQNLAFVLADAGYDVWLGNTRGNKYSCKHRTLKPTEEAFWDFSIDHLALHDLPDAVSYILKVTGAPSLSYIGFSQGSAQGFSALSMSRKLNKQVNLFIALAPATKPYGIDNRFVNALVNTSPEVIYLLFGRKSVLSSTLFWQSILSPITFATVIDLATWGLFSWTSEWLAHKPVVYRHLYSYTSVKMVVHWFQIIRTGKFQMYDENPTVIPNAAGGHLVPKFPTEQITTPFALFYGGKDTLPDMGYILRETPNPVFCLQVEEYEHLSFLWGRGIDKVVFPGVLGLLAEHSETWSDAQTASPSASTSDLPNPSSAPTFAQSRIRTVPWITEQEIDAILDLGRSRLVSGASSVNGSTTALAGAAAWAGNGIPDPSNTIRGVSYPGRISVAKLLKRIASSTPGIKLRRAASVSSTASGRTTPHPAAVAAADPPSYSESEQGPLDGGRSLSKRASAAPVLQNGPGFRQRGVNKFGGGEGEEETGNTSSSSMEDGYGGAYLQQQMLSRSASTRKKVIGFFGAEP
ncbi:cholesterol esterase [Phlyctochytrium bullatum]|nr:cholesterol esterase [Phlyctochytrium bullatum]